mmetsp:Transcript_8999/g.21919  ORF Transcript_8999/g.21919 Transcript_8999/m.21919 type:complete len:368 (+) Transcript_8999:687-1790(+)
MGYLLPSDVVHATQIGYYHILEKVEGVKVIANVAGAEGEPSVGTCTLGHFFGDVAILYYAGPAALGGNYAHLFVRTGLPQHFIAAVSLRFDAVSNERRIGRLHQRIIDPERMHVLDAFGFHVVQYPVLYQGGVYATVAVRSDGELRGRFEYHLAVGSHTGQRSLWEKFDVYSKIIVFRKVLCGCVVIQRARHDIKRHGLVSLSGQLAKFLDAFRHELKQSPFRGQADVVHSLGAIVPQSRALSPREQKRGDLPILYRLEARCPRLLQFGELGRVRGCGAGRVLSGERLDRVFRRDVRGIEVLELLLLVQRSLEAARKLLEGDLVHGLEEGELGLVGCGGRVEVGEDVGLAGGRATFGHGGAEGLEEG